MKKFKNSQDKYLHSVPDYRENISLAQLARYSIWWNYDSSFKGISEPLTGEEFGGFIFLHFSKFGVNSTVIKDNVCSTYGFIKGI